MAAISVSPVGIEASSIDFTGTTDICLPSLLDNSFTVRFSMAVDYFPVEQRPYRFVCALKQLAGLPVQRFGVILAAKDCAMRELTAAQGKMLTDLIELYARRLRKELADEELSKLRAAGMENVFFAWAGGGERGQPHYYRIQGPTFVIEYDNTQDHANHIHTVWRDFDHDFGLDPLRAHYLASPHHRQWHLALTTQQASECGSKFGRLFPK